MRRFAAALFAVAAPALCAHIKIVVTGMNADAIREFQSVSPDIKVEAADSARLPEQVSDADAIFGTINPQLFQAAKKLRWVQVYSAGVETYRFPEFINSNVTLTNCKVIQGPEIADHAMSLLLALTRDLYQVIPRRTEERWRRNEYHPLELRGKTAVVIGVGGIGTQIAQRASAFGMRVIGVDPKEMPFNGYVSKYVFPDQLDSVIPEADVVFISAPLTPKSKGMMGSRQFELMKKGSYFIAVSRGGLYDTNALVKALDEKRLAGAGMDVTNPEPLPPGHPLWKFENVIITPHIAGQSDGIDARRIALIKDNISRFVNGGTLVNIVDKQKGY